LVTRYPVNTGGQPCIPPVFAEVESLSNINEGYVIFIAVLAIVLAIPMIICAVFVLLSASFTLKLALQRFAPVLIFSVCFLTRSALFLWVATTGSSFDVIIFVVLEVIPVLSLCYFVFFSLQKTTEMSTTGESEPKGSSGKSTSITAGSTPGHQSVS